MTDIRLVHMADIHLGYTGSISLIFGEGERGAGRYVREVDIEQAVRRLTESIRDAQPPVDVVIIAGDLFHRSVPLPRAIARAARMVNVLISAGIDVVIVDGNHETSSSMHPGSPTVYLAELGAHVANGGDCLVLQGDRWHNPRLRGTLAVHALPYRAVLERQFPGVVPVSGCLNVLVTHGRIKGMKEEMNTLGRVTSDIPSEVLSRGWDYVALGDSHFHRYQPMQQAPAYYAGSLEALNFGEATAYPPQRDDRNAVRGAIDVRLRPGAQAVLSTLENVGRRPVLRLKAIDAADMEPETLMQALHDRITAELPREALVRLEVTACPIDVYERLDHEAIYRLCQQFRRCEIPFGTVYPVAEQNGATASEASLNDQWEAFIASQIGDDMELPWYLEQGQQRIEAARMQVQGARLESGEE